MPTPPNCTSCGALLPEKALFCPMCAAPVAAPVEPESRDPLRERLESALGSQCTIIRELGRGAMGAVYLAREQALDRLVAIKVLPPGHTDEPESRERFRREARIAAALTHPHIVPLHSFGEAEGMAYYVMGYVSGESLAEKLVREGALPPERVRGILTEIAGALDYAHRKSVVHRDVKPGNVLLDDETGHALLVDFGIARSPGMELSLTLPGGSVGTPHFMSPEQAAGSRDIDGRSDLYSLGVMGYQMLTGRLPFEGDDLPQVLARQITQIAEPVPKVMPEAPADLALVIDRCLAKAPEARWPDGASIVEALKAAPVGRDALPEDLARFESILPGYLLPGLVVGFDVILVSKLWDIPIEGGLPWLLLPLLTILFVVGVWDRWRSTIRLRGRSWRETVRIALWEPRWWRLWYPSSLLRPSSRRRWSFLRRLPASLRILRIAVNILFVYSTIGVFPLMMASLAKFPEFTERSPFGFFHTPYFVLLMIPIILIFLLLPVALYWRLKREFHGKEYEALIGGELADDPTFWNSPKVQAILRKGSDGR